MRLISCHQFKLGAPLVNQPRLFKYRHFEAAIVLLCVRWYLRYSLSYRDLEEMMVERGLSVDHTTIYRWVQHYAPILEKKCRTKLRPTNDSWRVDETYVRVKGQWMYLYRGVDSEGNTIEFMLSPSRDGQAAKLFFRKALKAKHTVAPRVINGLPHASSMSTRTQLARKRSKSSKRRVLCQRAASCGQSSI